MRNLSQLTCIALSLALMILNTPAQTPEAYGKVAHRLVELINAGDYSGIEGLFNKEMSEALPLDKSTQFFEGLNLKLGKIEKLDAPTGLPPAVVFPAHFERGLLDMQLSLDLSGKIAGLYFKPHTPTKPAPQKHQTQLSLPFKGQWLVFWGGDTKQQNAHHDVPNQRFAFDLLGVGPDGQTHRGNDKEEAQTAKNEDYYAFGREVLAPADGKVIEVIEGVRDNTPGSMNPYSALGNCVVIQHREDEVSVLAHFKQGSTKVKAGENVKRGQVLGLCGNSGNSSEPHIHYHLQNSPIIQDGLGIKCAFQKVVVTKGETKETKMNYSPVKGEIISPE
ncbi:MAG: peptidase M23 [Verrucomicrobia bacterium]|nr:MAG: peptidase M23 [Verrucomicrobiota bacterium]